MGKIVRDDRLSGDNRLVAELIAMWVDCMPTRPQHLSAEQLEVLKHKAEFLEAIIRSRFVTKKGDIYKHLDKNENDPPPATIEGEATAIERAAIDDLLGRR
jgi:hypothetical protein